MSRPYLPIRPMKKLQRESLDGFPKWEDGKGIERLAHRELDQLCFRKVAALNSPENVARFFECGFRGEFDEAIRAGGLEAVKRLTDRHPHFRDYVFESFMAPKRRGRPRQTHKYDYVGDAAKDCDHLRDYFRKHYGKWKRGAKNPPSVEELVVSWYRGVRVGMSVDDILNYRKNRPKDSRA
jgi:hypothetical protein